MDRFQSLSLTAQTAYAQLLDSVQALDLARSVADLNGSFASKNVKGRRYWYFQFTEISGRLRQLYVGPDSTQLRELIARQARDGNADALEPLARSAMALGCMPVLAGHFRVIRRLSEYGFFHAGGVLVGTHTFLAFGNMLGARWGDASRTQDVDFAHAGKQLAIALPADIEIDTPAAIESLKMGFLPLGSSDGKPGGTWLSPRDPDFQLDFVTPLHRGGTEPYRHPQLGMILQPLKFMEYLLEDLQQAALFCADGAVLVNVPHPARYALHKLIVAGERPAMRAAKSNKDLLQCAALLAVYRQGSVEQVVAAWHDLLARGPGWVSRTKAGLATLARLAPELDVQDWLTIPSPSSARRKGK